jgi:hypothetical protein
LTLTKFIRLLMQVIAADDLAGAAQDDRPRQRLSRDAR